MLVPTGDISYKSILPHLPLSVNRGVCAKTNFERGLRTHRLPESSAEKHGAAYEKT